jgi:hypothetical protein
VARRRSEWRIARRDLIDTFVAVFDDDATLTLDTDLDEAVLHLPDDRREHVRALIERARLDARAVTLHQLFGQDPETY